MACDSVTEMILAAVALVIIIINLVALGILVFDDTSSWLKLIVQVVIGMMLIGGTLAAFLPIADVHYGLYASPKVARYITGNKHAFEIDNDSRVLPREKFIDKHVTKSDTGYTQIDGHTFVIGKTRVMVPDSDKIIKHKTFSGEQQRAVAVTYTWKKGTSQKVKAAYQYSYGKLDKNNMMTTYE